MNNHQQHRQQPSPQVQLLRPQVKYTPGLPILEKREEILRTIAGNQVTVIAGETGSGKTTQLPLFCLEAQRGIAGKIGCTQPRRIAAVSIAARVANEVGCTLGNEVGYKIRFSDHDSPQTSVKFMTDGILLTEIERDPMLRQYDTLIIDEAHERSLNIDFILGYLRELLPKRTDLKVIISSATIDTALFSKAFSNAPVIEVSGRMYPVEVLYRTEATEDENESYVDAAVTAVDELLELYAAGDILVFMPSERDIRETCDRIRGRRRLDTLVLPLFSRLSRREQESVFATSNQRKVVVATNIAETSITVPGIMFVVDTGLARMSRYAPRLRTNRLPIEPVSQAAANQRMGRCGRTADGVCIRLYTAKDFGAREPFTLPEIKRSNLAGVILSMIAHRLGSIDTFPFLEPPSRTAITEGYTQLRELGALDRKNRITKLGRIMARLPLDPHIARMVIAARDEGALREVKIIAAALSIADPRERPSDKQAEANAMHARFRVPGSDFASFVRLWDLYADEWHTLKTQTKIRKFCRDHFLSFNRIREWHDVHRQIHELLAGMKGFEENRSPASNDAIHRSLLAGLLSSCAFKTDKGKYEGPRGQELIIFPGSALSGQKPDWIVCHQILETSRVFALTVAPIDPAWLEELGGDQCTRTYSDPWFDETTGVVRAVEKVHLFGLRIAEHRNVAFGKVNMEQATELFIREGLVDARLETEHPFYTYNKNLRIEVESLEARLRTRSLFAGEKAVEEFYHRRLERVGSVHDLNRVIKEHGDDKFLYMQREDLLTTEVPVEAAAFPDRITIGSREFPLEYAFEPGAEHDGVTLKVRPEDAPYITDAVVDYLVPALWPARIEELLRSLPKEYRKKLLPLSERASELARTMEVSNIPFSEALAAAIRKKYHLLIDSTHFASDRIPHHLSLRIEVCDSTGAALISGREAAVVRNVNGTTPSIDKNWNDSFKRYCKYGLTEWSCGSLPEVIETAAGNSGVPLYGYPAITASDRSIDLLVYPDAHEASRLHREGVRRLLETVCGKEFAWIERELKFTGDLKLLCAPLGGADKVRLQLLGIIRTSLLALPDPPRTQEQFSAVEQHLRAAAKGVAFELLSVTGQTFRLYNDNCAAIRRRKDGRLAATAKELRGDLDRYIRELEPTLPLERLRNYPRYLKAFGFRIERAFLEPAKYERNRASLETYRQQTFVFTDLSPESPEGRAVEEFRAMTEEFAISLFAQQEVKTRFPVSEKRLDKKLDEIRQREKKQGIEDKSLKKR